MEFPAEHKKGLSIAVVHSDKMKSLFFQCNLSIHEVGWRNFLLRNTRMVYGKNNNVKSIRRKRLAFAIAHDSYEKFVIDYANGATLRHPLSFARKLFRYIMGRLNKDEKTIFVEKLLKKHSKS